MVFILQKREIALYQILSAVWRQSPYQGRPPSRCLGAILCPRRGSTEGYSVSHFLRQLLDGLLLGGNDV